MPYLKIWDCQRLKKKMVNVENLQDLLSFGSEKLGLDPPVRAVLESDGTEVDEDDMVLAFREETFQLLQEAETWSSRAAPTVQPPDGVEVGHPVSHTFTEVATNISAHSASEAEELRVTMRTPLPVFSARIHRILKEGQALKVWNSAVNEAADYYMSKYPNIGSKIEYQCIGMRMVAEYPSVQQEGSRPWTLFTTALSQRVRHLRWAEKKKSAPPVTSSAGDGPEPPKKSRTQALVPEASNTQLLSDEDYRTHLSELTDEMKRHKPSPVHVKTILKETFENNQAFIKALPDGEVAAILKRLPCYEEGHYVVHDFKTILGSDEFESLKMRIVRFCDAAEKLMEDVGKQQPRVQGQRMLPIIKFIEEQTKLDRGKGSKSLSLIQEFQDIEDVDVDTNLQCEKYTPPHIRVFLRGSEITGAFIVTDTINIMAGSGSFNASILVLLACYYVFDLAYPRVYSQVLYILQRFILGNTCYTGIRSTKCLKFCAKLDAAFANLK